MNGQHRDTGSIAMEPVSLCCPFMFAPRVICLVFLFVLSCSQWSLCLCVVHSCLPIGKLEWTTQRHRLHWEQDRTKRNTKQINRMGKHEWTTQRHRLHWEQDRTKRNTKQINRMVFLFVLSCSQWSLCLYVVHSCLPIRFICLVFLFVLSCSQWSLCLCVVHSCLPLGLFVWSFFLFWLLPNGV
jgi:hypothetical protein